MSDDARRPLGTYERLGRLGAGGMADLWLARQHRAEGVQRTVVLKHMHGHLQGDRDMVLAFLDEARLLARLNHPCIVHMLDLEVVDGTYALVLEHVDGLDLRALLEHARSGPTRRLPDRASLAIASALAEALAYIHSRTDDLGDPLRIVHRDINPSNVLVGRDGSVRLIDFGIAAAEMHEHRTRTGVLKGTPGYVAPEQLVDGERVDARADVFSFGTVLYELLGGQPAFPTGGSLTPAGSSARAEHTPLDALRADLDRDLVRLVERCLVRNPAARYADGTELAEVLATMVVRSGGAVTMRELGRLVEELGRSEPTRVDVREDRLTDGGETPAPRRRPWRALAMALVATLVATVAYLLGRWLGS